MSPRARTLTGAALFGERLAGVRRPVSREEF